MGKLIDALLQLQSVELDLAHLRHRLKARQSGVAAQERKIEQLQKDYDALHQQSLDKRKDSDRLSLDLRGREEQVARLRANLNTAKTNKEYAAILTQINTLKADNSKLEEVVLSVLQQVDAIKADAEKVQQQIQGETARLEELRRTSGGEIQKLQAMMSELTARRAQAAATVPPEGLAVFERIAANYDGEGMAAIQIHGERPPHDYVCGGCFMSLNAEHVNALRVRDEIRICDNCGRILYLEKQTENSPA